MSGPQFMPFYVGDYLADTQHLTTEQHGAYLLLLFACWSMAKLPDNDEKLMAITHCESMAKWRKLRKTLEPFFKISHGLWQQKRVEKERRQTIKKHKGLIEAGKRGALSRWGHKTKTDNGQANGQANGKTMARLDPLPPFPQTPFPSSPPQPEPDSSPPIVPPSQAKGGRGARRFPQSSARMTQIEGFAHALAQRNRDC